MSYCQVSDVQDVIPLFPIADTSSPTTAQVQTFITNVGAEIDSAIASRGIEVPVTLPAWWVADLLRLNAQGAAATTLMAMFPLEQGQGSLALGPNLWKTYQLRLDEIRKGIGIPTGIAYAEADQAPRSYLVDLGAWNSPNGSVIDGFGNPVKTQPVFTMEKIF